MNIDDFDFEKFRKDCGWRFCWERGGGDPQCSAEGGGDECCEETCPSTGRTIKDVADLVDIDALGLVAQEMEAILVSRTNLGVLDSIRVAIGPDASFDDAVGYLVEDWLRQGLRLK